LIDQLQDWLRNHDAPRRRRRAFSVIQGGRRCGASSTKNSTMRGKNMTNEELARDARLEANRQSRISNGNSGKASRSRPGTRSMERCISDGRSSSQTCPDETE
jgi:hypothetical protein